MNSMPNIPRFEMVKVLPIISADVSRRFLARSVRSANVVTICPRLRLCLTDDGHDQVLFNARGNS